MEIFEEYLDMAGRRKWWVIIPFLLVTLAGLTFALLAPRVYKAETLILVQPQKVPEDFVQPIVAGDVDDRLNTIAQQVTSRTNLEKIIQKYDLYTDLRNEPPLHRKVALIRRDIDVDVSSGTSRRGGNETNSFTISFSYDVPIKARDVVNALAANFIEENLRTRESQAVGTSDFITDELESVKRQLEKKEEELKQYRERNMGGLPEQLETNLSTLERLQSQMDQLHKNLMDAENRRIVIQARIAEEEKARAVSGVAPQGSEPRRPQDLPSLKAELKFLESKFSQVHPDVIQLNRQIRELEAVVSESGSESAEEQIVAGGADEALPSQLQEIELEIKTQRAEIPQIQAEINRLQTKVEETPKREQELLTLNRDYENLKSLYNGLLQRKLEAKIAVSMERKQKGEQFRIIDPAKTPAEPIKPNLRKVMLLTLLLGLGLGGGLAYMVETADKSYKSPKEVEQELELPILMAMPIRYSKKQLIRMRVKGGLAVTSVAVGFVACALGIILAVKGVEDSKAFAQDVVGKLEERIPVRIPNLFN